ncbi:MAG TPA: GNAT family N-acetyltransferase [Trebonia sp.]|jgi:predicted GNAT superfamily acetyltransferase|nr:GNAT family N-acetyltransferase [Trebonia sp.]
MRQEAVLPADAVWAALPAQAAAVPEAELAEATRAAGASASAAGVSIRLLTELADLKAVVRLYDEIWRPDPARPPISTELLRALTKAGNYTSGAFDRSTGAMIGACAGFFGPPAHGELHSHIAGVLPSGLGRGVGFALKLHQRAWVLGEGATSIAWTFDPLVRRNAYFNLVKLGARPAEYLANFYGVMNDAINGTVESDRMLVRWDLRSPLVADASAGTAHAASAAAELDRGATVALSVDADGGPAGGPIAGPIAGTSPAGGLGNAGGLGGANAAGSTRVLVAVPPDIEAMRAIDPGRAAAWRAALRDVLAPALAEGGRVTAFDRAGWYVIEPAITR